MDILGTDIAKAKFDAALLIGGRVRHAAFPSTKAGFEQLLAWLAKQRPDPAAPVHACMEATGNWGLDLAAFLHAAAVPVSIVNPARIKAYGDSELARNMTDRLNAALIPFVGLPTATPLEPLQTPPASAGPRSRWPVRRLPRTCVNFVSWSAAATRSRQPASRNSTVGSPASLRLPWRRPSLPMLPGSTRRSRPSWTQCAALSPLIPS